MHSFRLRLPPILRSLAMVSAVLRYGRGSRIAAGVAPPALRRRGRRRVLARALDHVAMVPVGPREV